MKQRATARGHNIPADIATIRSAGDLEVVLLHEAHSALAQIIGPELYQVLGKPPDQCAMFHTQSSFDLFLILLVEFIAEGPRCAWIDSNFQNWSLLKGLRWLCSIHDQEVRSCGLSDAVSVFEDWLAREVVLGFWVSDVNTKLRLPLRNDMLIWFGANTAKHHILRLGTLVSRLNRLCITEGYSFAPQEILAVLDAMVDAVQDRLQYHSTYLLEMLGRLFFALNNLNRARHLANPTNHVARLMFPTGVSSDVFKNMYGDVLIFQVYEDTRILSHTPVTDRFLRLRY